MANIVLLLLIVMFIFAILGVTFFGRASKRYFGDLPTALFSLFICITQDGWMGVFEELEKEGMYVAAAVYLVAFIMIGAFVFANLVVAVVVTNLEIAVDKQRQAEGSKVEEGKPEGEESDTTATVDVSAMLSQHWRSQRPYEIPDMSSNTSVEKLENYFIVLSALEDNIYRFKTLKQELSEIIHNVKEMNPKWDETHVQPSLADIPATRIYRLSTSHRRPSIAIREDRAGDLLSELLALNREKHIDSRNANAMSDLVKQTVFYLYRKDSIKPAPVTVSRASSNRDRND
ncbi:cation channel sperm-associated protein 4-like [Corticium candelabrum]|uniref:cation channel sperm-associated protein 4-like n=1 Tax=Corticium candelabrum TaxID=121492 RepID=UPI002E2EFECB|nr:cation channel sperm-associated protein 4-like [Corticium candelabrum]